MPYDGPSGISGSQNFGAQFQPTNNTGGPGQAQTMEYRTGQQGCCGQQGQQGGEEPGAEEPGGAEEGGMQGKLMEIIQQILSLLQSLGIGGAQQPGAEQPGTQQPGTQQPGTQQPGTQLLSV